MEEQDTIRILVAEDEESFLRVLTAVLESTRRFEVYPCEDGRETVEALKRQSFDLVILDYKMPGMTGLNVLQWMHEQKMETPVIVLTAAGSESIAVEAMKLGAYDYIRKDNFDREHFPIVVSGVYERYLFKKEKEKNDDRALERQRNDASLTILRNSVSSFSSTLETSLTKIDLLLNQSVEVIGSETAQEERQKLGHYFDQIRKEHEAIAGIAKSMVRLLRTIYDAYSQPSFIQPPSDTSSAGKETTKKMLTHER